MRSVITSVYSVLSPGNNIVTIYQQLKVPLDIPA